MKNRTLVLLLAILANAVVFLSFTYSSIVQPSPGTEVPVDPFENIALGGCWDVYVSNGPATTLRMEGEQADIDKIEVSVKDKTLQINLKKDEKNCSGNVKIYVSTPQLKDLVIGGSGSITLEGKFTNTTSMNISVAGTGSISGNISTPDVDVDIAGSGNIVLSGDTKQLDIDIAGSGSFDGKSLSAERVDTDIAGSGSAYVNASSELDVEIAGSGDVYYTGNAEVTRSIAGSGKIHKN